MKNGFLPALGTPLNKDGSLVVDSFKKQICDQIDAGAAGLLALGSMGIEAFIRNNVYSDVVKAAVDAAKGRVPVFVGAMDTSVSRVKDRISEIEDYDISGVVVMAPFYSPATQTQMMNFFKSIAQSTTHSFLIYDLPVICQAKITYEMVLELIKTVPNFAGIKSADMQMFRKLKLNPDVPEDFIMVYSGLDTFDIAYKWGIRNCLDGMLSCTPANTGKMFKAMESGNYDVAAKCLNNILSLRDCFIANELWPSFTAAMNLLGYSGNFAPDYMPGINDSILENVKNTMIRIKEL